MNRAQKLITKLQLPENAAVLIANESNIFYVSGYRGEGLAFVSNQQNSIITDFRYTEQAQNEAPGFSVAETTADKGPSAVVAECLRSHGITTLYYEDDVFTVKKFAAFQRATEGITWLPLNGIIEDLRIVKDETELAIIEQACKITSESFERIIKIIKVGMTEKEIALALNFDMLKNGADDLAFSTIIAAGANGSLPHAVPGEYRVQAGDMITMDFGAKLAGYCADMTRTVAVGEPSKEMRKVYETVQTAQAMAQDAVAPGKYCRDIDAIARDYIHANGYEGRFGHGLGHSLGIDIHEEPRCNTVATAKLRVGQLMTIEPGIYLPGIGGVRIENSVVVTETGSRAITLPTRELIIL